MELVFYAVLIKYNRLFCNHLDKCPCRQTLHFHCGIRGFHSVDIFGTFHSSIYRHSIWDFLGDENSEMGWNRGEWGRIWMYICFCGICVCATFLPEFCFIRVFTVCHYFALILFYVEGFLHGKILKRSMAKGESVVMQVFTKNLNHFCWEELKKM